MVRRLIILSILISLSSTAISCSFPGEEEIEFEPKDTTLGITKAQALAHKFIKWRDEMGIGSISISSYSIENNAHSTALSLERMDNILRIINSLNKNNAPIEINKPITIRPHTPTEFLSNFAVIIVQPACIKTNICCPSLDQHK
ncbi:MAG: hypothetical protein LBE78_09200 [Burkholderiaceae bacterium]|jgi:hypothetical protein|nr:hypothetical protein [Burkholderiaceae bacterium]